MPPAAPAGGACRSRGRRGCALITVTLVSVLLADLPCAGWAAAPITAQGTLPAQEMIPVPSGQTVRLHEVLLDDTPGALWGRFRFIAPQIGHAITPDDSAADMDHLCATVALPYLAQQGLSAARVVISLSDRVVPFGESAPDATQYFEAYRPEDDRCIWEGF
ncbi:DUF6497 family protein [Antarcticimicrobium sediminis]|uniref:Acetolactate synthase n=1 Tax=Antarcticimicrobium sediminis TaxID=2546227 RepID=A0A4R5F194_9RHOB|nr:DUF6497 family protein [Antarcticimicrobium sediminis]TDE41214.1 hypothetical protein E1B25_03205 [Antarcticimicrobium sediminis]